MLKSKKAKQKEEKQKILWVENLYIVIVKIFFWSFTTQVMKQSDPIEIRRRNETYSDENK